MKKIALFLVLVLVSFSLFSCKKDGGDDNKKDPVVKEEFKFETPVTDSLTLNKTYEGLDFVENGIGTATVVSFVDGDTTIFRTSGGHKITVRYQGIDTPESTYTVDPWGFTASAYTKNALKNAKTIVLEAESMTNRLDSTGKRYLAWVWIDGKLLNLQIAEVGLAEADASDTTYASKFIDAIRPVMLAKERIYGGKDPNYDYSGTREIFTIKELREKYGTAEAISNQTDKGKRISITGTVTKRMGSASAYIQQYNSENDTYYGMYVYGGYGQISELDEGNTVILNGTLGYYYGQLQISSITSASIEVFSFNNRDSVTTIDMELSELSKDNYSTLGNLIHISEPIEITGYNDSDDSGSKSFTLRTNYKCSDDTYLSIRVDQNSVIRDQDGNRIESGESLVGKTIEEFTGILSYYDGNYGTQSPELYDGYIQLMWTSYNDVEFK